MSLSLCNGIFENIYDAPHRNGDGNQGEQLFTSQDC